MKQECPTYLKSVWKSKAIVATLSDTESEIELDNSDDENILNVFTVIVDPIEGVTETVDNEKDLVDSKFEKWSIKMTSIQPMQNCTRFLRSMRNCIGQPPRS